MDLDKGQTLDLLTSVIIIFMYGYPKRYILLSDIIFSAKIWSFLK